LQLGNAFTALHPLDGRQAALPHVVLDLLYPEGENTLGDRIDPNAQAVRIGVTVTGRDGNNYRILRDLRTDRISMQRADGQGGYAPVSGQPAEIMQAVTAQLGFPQRDILEKLFVTRRSDLPSQRQDAFGDPNAPAPQAMGSGEGAPVPPGYAAGGENFGHLSPEQKEAKLAETVQSLQILKQIADLEFEMDGYQKRGFELDDALRDVDALERAGKEAQNTVAAGQLPPDEVTRLLGLVTEYKSDKERFETDSGRIKEEIKGLQLKYKRHPIKADEDRKTMLNAAATDPLVMWGTAAGFAAMVLALVGAFTFPPLRWIAFVDIPAFGVALFGAWRFLSEAEFGARMLSKIARNEEDLESLKKKYELSESHVRSILEKQGADVKVLGEFEHFLNGQSKANAQANEAIAAMEREKAKPEIAALLQERTDVRAKVKEFEEKLYATGGVMGDKSELRRNAVQLAKALDKTLPPELGIDMDDPDYSGPMGAAPGMGSGSYPSPAAGGFGGGPANQSGAYNTIPDLTPELSKLAADALMTSLDAVCQALPPRVGQVLSGLSDRRYGQAIFGPDGGLSVVEVASGRAIPFVQLTPGDRDLAYLALKITIIESVVAKARLPVILDQAFGTFPDTKHQLLGQLLQYLGGRTQVLCMTNHAALAQAAANLVQIA
jgi:hypothetical protein